MHIGVSLKQLGRGGYLNRYLNTNTKNMSGIA